MQVMYAGLVLGGFAGVMVVRGVGVCVCVCVCVWSMVLGGAGDVC